MISTLLLRLGGTALMGALLVAKWHYPVEPLWLSVGLVSYGALLWWRPHYWLFVVPALLPVLDFAPFTGQIYFGEVDLLLLATAAVGYLRTSRSRPQAAIPASLGLGMAILAASWSVSLAQGMLPLAPLDANAFASYFSRYNALRVFSGLAWVLVLLPLFLRTAGEDLHNIKRSFIPGMMAGLALTALVVAWERAMFPGLLNFAADYRPTGPFSSMHTGGAALDAYLALAFPFVAAWLLAAASQLRQLAAFPVLLLGCYASFAIFSRDMYLAFAGAGLVAGGFAAACRFRSGAFNARSLLLAAGLLAITALALSRVFATSGYRGLGAAITLMVAAMVLATSPARLSQPGAALAGMAAAAALAALLEKGSYIAVALSAVAFGAGAPRMYREPEAKSAALPVAAFAALAVGTAAVAQHWGGNSAAAPALMLAALAVTLVAAGQLVPRNMWEPRAALTGTLFFAVVLATLIPAAASYYLGTRFATTADDLQHRLRHWSNSFAMMDKDLPTRLFGMGLGRYPETYFWRNASGEMPGHFIFAQSDEADLFLQLAVPRYQAGYGEVLRMLQRVDAPPGGRYLFSVDVRRSNPKTLMQAAVCERWLLYPQNCAPANFRMSATLGEWQRYSAILKPIPANTAIALLHPPTQLELAAVGPEGALDIDNVSLVDLRTNKELVRNGAFSRASEGWFFSSDRSHLPWHAKNAVVHTVFETGWVGLGAACLVLLAAASSLARRALRAETHALICLASLTGFLMVGLFDSLFDVPRLTLAFFLVLLVACAKPRSAPPATMAARSGM